MQHAAAAEVVVLAHIYLVVNYNCDALLCRYFQHAQFIPIVGVGKRGAY